MPPGMMWHLQQQQILQQFMLQQQMVEAANAEQHLRTCFLLLLEADTQVVATRLPDIQRDQA